VIINEEKESIVWTKLKESYNIWMRLKESDGPSPKNRKDAN
jgi:hypothetical protein